MGHLERDERLQIMLSAKSWRPSKIGDLRRECRAALPPCGNSCAAGFLRTAF
jgi:hypothetical protein